MKKLYIFLKLFLVSALLLSACSGKQETKLKVIKVESVSLNQILTGLDVTNRDPQTPLFANVLPSNSTNKKLTWKSDNPSAIKIIDEATGELKIVGIENDTATISVTTEDGNKEASILVKLVQINTDKIGNAIQLNLPENFVKTNASNEKYLELKAGQSAGVSTTVTPLNAADKVLIWKSNKSDTVSVDSNGILTAHKGGNVTITVALKHKQNIKQTFKVVVANPVLVNKVTITPAGASLKPEASRDLAVVYEPVNATSKNVSWSSNKENIVSVDANGKITASATAKAGDTATITATSTDGSDKNATMKVTIIAHDIAATGISLDTNAKNLIKSDASYKTHQIRVAFTPFDATERELEYTSSASSIATVSTTGLVTAVNQGTANIEVKLKNKPSIKATLAVTVENDLVFIDTIKVSPKVLTSDKISSGSTLIKKDLYAETNASATVKDIVWVSEDPDVATVDANGKITFKGFGKALVWAISGVAKKSDSAQVLAIELNPTEVTVDPSATPEEQAKQKANQQLARSIKRIPIKASGKSFKFTNTSSLNLNNASGVDGLSQNSDCVMGGSCNKSTNNATLSRNFEIGQTEVTYRLWNAVYVWATTPSKTDANKRLDDNGAIYKFQNHGELGAYGVAAGTQNLFYGDDLQPVSRISWRDAIVWSNAYTEWLNAKTGTSLKPVYWNSGTTSFTDTTKVLRSSLDANATNAENPAIKLDHKGIRLPTRKEWEFTARLNTLANNIGVSISFDGKTYKIQNGRYAVGATDLADTYAAKVGYVKGSTIDASPKKPYTQKVGTITTGANGVNPCAHPLEICDMTGNLWEWTNDLLSASRTGTNKRANFKGGSYFKVGNEVRALYDGFTKTTRNDWPDIGFRIAKTID